MTAEPRINVSSGRPLEGLAHYSRALRVGELVLQSGTTAIDRDGNVLGENVSAQIDAILELAHGSMGAADGVFENVVRARLYVTDSAIINEARCAFESALSGISPVVTLVPICQLARPKQLIEIELEAVDNASKNALHIDASEFTQEGSAAISIGGRILIGGIAASGGSATEQVVYGLNVIQELIRRAAGNMEDLVAVKFFIVDISQSAEIIAQAGRLLGTVRPTVTITGIPPLADSNVLLIVEGEALKGAGDNRSDTPHPHFSEFSESVVVNDQIYLSNFTPVNRSGMIQHPGDWAAQIDYCLADLGSVLIQLGGSLDDVIVRRFFTREDTEMNRAYGDGPGWFSATRPTALGCRIIGHQHEKSLISVEAHAVRGARNNIDWRMIEL